MNKKSVKLTKTEELLDFIADKLSEFDCSPPTVEIDLDSVVKELKSINKRLESIEKKVISIEHELINPDRL